MDRIKYYICIKEGTRKSNSNKEASFFISYAFKNEITKDEFRDSLSGVAPDFTLGHIYPTRDGYIVDEQYNHHRIVDVKEYLKPYHFEIDPIADSYIKKKEQKGDRIKIIPRYRHDNGVIGYEIKISLAYGRFSRIFYSETNQAIAIVNGYKELRKSSPKSFSVREALAGIYHF